jgi:hypothetical protein
MKKILFILLFLIIFIQFTSSQNINDIIISEVIIEFEMFCMNNSYEINWENVEILFSLRHDDSLNIILPPDKHHPPAEMLFLSNSIMILNSVLFSESYKYYENRYFIYSLNNKELTLTFIDSRLIPYSRWLFVEKKLMNNGNSILSVDEINNVVVYYFGDGFYPHYNRIVGDYLGISEDESYFYRYKNGFYFGGIIFHGEYSFHPNIIDRNLRIE